MELTNVASVNFMKLSSYKGTNTTGKVKIDLDLTDCYWLWIGFGW